MLKRGKVYMLSRIWPQTKALWMEKSDKFIGSIDLWGGQVSRWIKAIFSFGLAWNKLLLSWTHRRMYYYEGVLYYYWEQLLRSQKPRADEVMFSEEKFQKPLLMDFLPVRITFSFSYVAFHRRKDSTLHVHTALGSQWLGRQSPPFWSQS